MSECQKTQHKIAVKAEQNEKYRVEKLLDLIRRASYIQNAIFKNPLNMRHIQAIAVETTSHRLEPKSLSTHS